MKFEEALPKMRDEGRIGVRKERRHKFEEGEFLIEYPPGNWSQVFLGASALTKDDWTIEPIKVKKWRWAWGSGYSDEPMLSGLLTAEEVEKYMKMHGFDWAERINDTMVEVEE